MQHLKQMRSVILVSFMLGTSIIFLTALPGNAQHLASDNAALTEEKNSYLRDDWRDAEKSVTNPDDDWMCWAAAAANTLDWAGWGTALFDTAQDIFYTFQNYWTNASSFMQYAWQWWLDGTEPPNWYGWSHLKNETSETEIAGGYWTDYNFFDYFYEDWADWDAETNQWSHGSQLMPTIDEYLHNNYGVTLAIYNDWGAHALTAWGYEYDESGNYTGLWVTDSDDYTTGLHLLSVTFDLKEELWFLDPDKGDNSYNGWFIGGVQALDRLSGVAPVPEPGTFVLVILGLLSVTTFTRKQCKMNRR